MKEQLIEALALMSDRDIASGAARAFKSMMDALLVNGFTRDEAMQLLVAHGIGVQVNK